MKAVLHHIVALLALALHLVSGVALEFTHHEGHLPGGSRGSALRPHDCGGQERHVPLDAGRFCGVCMQSLARAATAAGTAVPATLSRSTLPLPAPADRSLDNVDLLHSGTRGPPRA